MADPIGLCACPGLSLRLQTAKHPKDRITNDRKGMCNGDARCYTQMVNQCQVCEHFKGVVVFCDLCNHQYIKSYMGLAPDT